MHGLTEFLALSSSRLLVAAAVTVGFALLGRWIRGVSPGGAVAGAGVCFVLYASAGPGAFAALVAVFALTWVATRMGYRRKLKLGTAEPRDGRTARQVLANLGVATVCAAAYVVAPTPIFLVAMAAALAEAAADTVSSELGQAASSKARLITTWEQVPAGTDGGITGIGTLAGLASALAVSVVCAAFGLFPWRWVAMPVLGALAGTIADSYLGAALERRGKLHNDAVNFLSTVVAAVVASGLY